MFIAVAALLAALPLTFGTFWINMVITALIFSLAVFSINLLTGLTGLLSFGQAGFVGIGAYTTALLTTHGWPFWPTFALAGVACFVVGWVLGYPALRVQHHYLAFVTLAFNTLVFLIFRNEEWLTGGNYGIYQLDSQEGPQSSVKEYPEGNMGHRPSVKGGYFPVPPVGMPIRPIGPRVMSTELVSS